MECRSRCGACCVVPSISTALPGLPFGKPPFVPCEHLDLESRRCAIWMHENYPRVCRDFTPNPAYCGRGKKEAFYLLTEAEILTAPVPPEG